MRGVHVTGSHQCDVSRNIVNYIQTRTFRKWDTYSALFPLYCLWTLKSWWMVEQQDGKEPGFFNNHMEENHPLVYKPALDCYMYRKGISITLCN